MLTKVLFAFTRSSYVRFEYVIKKSDIFRRSFGFEHHFLPQRKYRFVSGAPGDEKKVHPGGRKNNFFEE